VGAFADFIKGAATILPEIKKPTRKPSLTEKLVWTAVALAVYLVMAVVPLTGVSASSSTLSYSSIIFASQQGTLMTLGIGPIVTAGLILQLLKGSDIIRLDFTKPADRALFTSATKFLTMIVIIVEASAYLIGGILGSVSGGIYGSIVIFFELFLASVIVMLLDEMVQKGWGIGSGISLFILAGVAQRLMWDIFSPITVALSAGRSTFYGIVAATINATSYGRIGDVFFRPNAPNFPNLLGLILTIVAILIIIYFEGMRIEIPITSTKYRGFSGVYPIKLLYVSNIPVILFSALVANITFFSQYLWSHYNPNNTNQFFNYLVKFDPANTQQGPIGGLVYYMSGPNSFAAALADPVRSLTYIGFAVAFSVMFAKIWVEIGGLSPKAAAQNLIGADVQVPGFRRTGASVEAILSKYIPVITIIGGVFIGLLASLSQILGVYGTGVGILLMVDIIIQYYQLLMREQLETMMPRLGALLGKS
jgi:protein transport protein SEC61 subunit alpha